MPSGDGRAGVAAMLNAEPAAGVEVTRRDLGGVACVVCTPAEPQRTIVHFHGGGYRLGSPEASIPFASKLAAATSSRVVAVTYRLAPEHPYPAAVLDATAAYAAVLEEYRGEVVVAGESAGGGLAAALALACLGSGVAVPDALVLMSPWVDLTVTAATYTANAATDVLFSHESASQAAEMYLQGHDTSDPLASPLFGELAGLPRTMVLASTDEVLLTDATSLSARLAAAGVEVLASLQPGRQHAWPAIFPDEDASTRALEMISGFLRS